MSSAEVIEENEPNAWWTTLKHDGVLLSPPVLEDIFPEGPPEIREREIDDLRRDYRNFRNDPDELRDWLDTVFEDLLEHTSGWEKEHLVSDEYTHQDLRPNRVLVNEEDDPRIAVWIDDDRVTNDAGEPGRIGIYSGRRTYADLVKLLRNSDIPVGILTNGHQFRVVHATLDRESWTEWDAQAWFEGGEGRDALRGFYGLLSDEVLASPAEDDEESLLDKIEESRERQADLSDVMGTQVREAVEMLLQELDSILMEVDEETREEILAPLKEQDINRQEELRARYQASIRIIMRLVVALYAESRELFPKDNPVYYDSYSVEGLFRELREAKIEDSEEALEKQYGAWPRLQSLSRLIYHGSPHPDIAMQSYGGRLFRPPSEDGEDDVLAGIEVFEHDEVRITDATILEILEKLKIAEFRSGGSRRRGPVDFSELRTEYIGMMYEGLLDYDLREATEDDGAIVFLNIGDEPALPFNVLENLDDDGLNNLVDNLKDESSGSFLADEKISEEDFDEEELEATEEDGETDEDQEGESAKDIEARVHQWAKRVVEETGVYMPHHNTVRAMDPTIREKYEDKAAKRLVDRIIRPGGTYLVSWEGTRKSTGTFYTPPGLAVPTVHRTLKPKVYDKTGEGKPVPKQPSDILNLKVCDPAMGSGTFPVAAIRYLTEGLKESFEEHVFPEINEGEPIAAPLGEKAKGILNERLLSIRKGEDEDWEQKLELQLKRAIVERCIYGVDINPLAVELGKLSIWIETMDPELPFTFLDHKLRVGNSLVGAWLHEFQHYPVAAWNRDGANDERDKRIRSFRNNDLKEQMRNYIKQSQYETHWFETGPNIENLIERARETFESLHESVDESERERLYQKEFRENEDIQTLRHLMDRWCAIWFWPMDSDDTPVLDPDTFYNTIHDEKTDPIVEKLADGRKTKFFHWELEFPDVFSGDEWGFDAILGNPPWDKEKPNSLEFFTRYRPEFRTYGKQQAKKVRKQLFEDQPQIERDWWDNVSFYKGLSNYVSYSSDPWDVPLGRGKQAKRLEKEWRKLRNEVTHLETPFRYQGSADLNSYKLFAEKFHFLTKKSGRVGAILPSGIYSDYGNQELRKLFLENSHWEWIFSFENRKGIFDIHRSYKFSANVLQNGTRTEELKCRFMVHDLEEWNRQQTPDHLTVTRKQIQRFSPEVRGILEVRHQKDIEILDTIYKNTKVIRDTDLGYTREFDMTNDSELFYEEEWLTEQGWEIDEDGIVWDSDSVVGLPLLEGRHIDCFDYQYSAHIEGHGRSADWEELAWDNKRLGAQYWMLVEDLVEHPDVFQSKVGFMDVTSASNRRTMRASVLPHYPCGNKVPVLEHPDYEQEDYLVLSAILNSYALDFVARRKIQGLNANWYIVKSFPLPDLTDEATQRIAELSKKLHDSITRIELADEDEVEISHSGTEALQDDSERARIREEIDKIIADAYGLSKEDMEWILRPDDEDPRNLWKDYKTRLSAMDGQGKWGEISEAPEEEEVPSE